MPEINYTLRMNDLFTNKMRSAINDAEKLEAIMGRIGGTTGGGGTGNKRQPGIIGTLGRGLMGGFGLSTVAGPLAAVAGIATLTKGFISFEKHVVSSLAAYQRFHVSVKAMMGGDEYKSLALESQLVKLAKETPFSLTQVQESTKMMMAYGYRVSEVNDNLRMLGEVAAGSGSELKDLVYVHGTLKTQIQVYKRDLNQMTTRGINIIPTLISQLGLKNAQELFALIKKGKVDFHDVDMALNSMTRKGGIYFNQMAEQSKTVGGKLERLGESWTQLGVHVGQAQEGMIHSTIDWLIKTTYGLDQYVMKMNAVNKAIIQAQKEGKGTGEPIGFVRGIAAEYMQNNPLGMLVNMLNPGFKERVGVSHAMEMNNLYSELQKSKYTDYGNGFKMYPEEADRKGMSETQLKIFDETNKTNEDYKNRNKTGLGRQEYENRLNDLKKRQNEIDISTAERTIAAHDAKIQTLEGGIKNALNPKQRGELENMIALVREMRNIGKGRLDMLRDKSLALDDETTSTLDSKGIDTGISTTTGRQDITININGPLAAQTFEMSEGTATADDEAFYRKIKKNMSRVYLELVNDANSVAKNR